MIPRFKQVLMHSAFSHGLGYSVLSSLPSNMTLGRASSGTYWNGTSLATAGSNVPRFDSPGGPSGLSGLLIEPQSTNRVRNNTLVGAVVGTPGTLPTNWNNFSGVDGLSQQVVGSGVMNGINYVDIRYYGTTSNTSLFSLDFEQNLTISAGPSQTWTHSLWLAVVGGSLSNFPLQIRIPQRNSSGTLLVGNTFSVSPNNNLTRYDFTANFSSDATTTNTNCGIFVDPPTGVPVDVTLRIGMPQLEQLPYATSVILTAGSAVTRAADVLTYNGNDSAQSMILTASDGTTQELHKDPFVPWVINPLNLNKLNVVQMRTGTPNTLFGFDVVATTTVSGNLSTATGTTVTIYWGDGTTTALSGTSQAYSKTYSTAIYTSVVIKGPVGALTSFTMDNGTANIAFNLSSLPSGMTYFNCVGNNTVSGSISSLPSGMTTFNCLGNNTISGSISSLPSGMTYFCCVGNNTVSGSISSLPSGMTYFNCQGNNTINTYTTKTWANNQDSIYLVPVAGGGLSSGSVDQLCIDLANVSTWTGGKTLYLKGTNAAPTGASAAARATIAGKGVTVTTN